MNIERRLTAIATYTTLTGSLIAGLVSIYAETAEALVIAGSLFLIGAVGYGILISGDYR